MTTFGLVHGAYHGAWCWQPLIDELERRGHHGLAVDLPSEDPDAGALEYADTAVDAFAAADEEPRRGRPLPRRAHHPARGGQRRPVSRLVYLCAMLPRPGRAHDT